MKKRSRNFPLIPGIILGAIFGAVAFMVLLRFPDFVIRALSGDLRGLPRILSSIFYDAFSTPWGAIGGLVLAGTGFVLPSGAASDEAAAGVLIALGVSLGLVCVLAVRRAGLRHLPETLHLHPD